uniref:Sulfatase domain-containing protein n=1 Tax=Panagrellus redivivus TaxID=6233 RepID=A0A7E4VEC5_PANRE
MHIIRLWFGLLRNLVVRNRITVLILLGVVCFFALRPLWQTRQVPTEYLEILKKIQSIKTTKSTQCKVPQLNPFDPSILSYYSKPAPLQCKQFQPNVTHVDGDGFLRINSDYVKSHSCQYRYFTRKEGTDDENLDYGNWIAMEGTSVKLEKEFVEVECKTGMLGAAYRYQWFHVIPKVVNVAKKKIATESTEHPSVIMIGLDSMSRGNFVRQLPKTHKLLDKLNFTEMRGHVKVMDNTFGNWMAILTGKASTSTREFPTELPDEWHLWFDDWDLAWRHFAAANYSTFFAEDRPDIGTFNYFGYLNGFKYAPTDHYFRPYWLSCFWSMTFRRSTTGCYDAKSLHGIQLDYLERYLKSYANQRKFAWWWSQDLSHDHLNLIGVADSDLAAFIDRNYEAHFKDAIVIVFSDHGHRYASIRETVIGRLEARLPYLAIHLPEKWSNVYPHLKTNLEANSKLMTTQYDMHETLLHLASGKFDTETDTKEPKHGNRAFSLLQKVDKYRNCYDSHVPEDYCPCFEEIKIGPTEAMKPAVVLADYANGLLEKFNRKEMASEPGSAKYECAKLEIEKVSFASIRLPPPKLIADPQVQNSVAGNIQLSYRIAFTAKSPSNASIEGVVLRNLDDNGGSGVWTATGELERNNRYGNTSHCVADRILKKICHCLERV